MKRVYVDTSALLAIHFGERGASIAARVLRAHEQRMSALFVVAEVLSALRREGRPLAEADRLLRPLVLVSAEGPMRAACEEALRAGPLRGADLWHVATALLVGGRRSRMALTFCSLDDGQRDVARMLGFPVAP